MITFAEIVKEMHNQRIKDLQSQQTITQFRWNSRGVRETSFKIAAKMLATEETKLEDAVPIGTIEVFYADQNPRTNSYEAKMVKSRKWKATDVGWLWTYLNGIRIWLAKITPEGILQITRGFIKDNVLFFYKNRS